MGYRLTPLWGLRTIQTSGQKSHGWFQPVSLLQLRQPRARVAEVIEFHAQAIHQREVEAADFAVLVAFLESSKGVGPLVAIGGASAWLAAPELGVDLNPNWIG